MTERWILSAEADKIQHFVFGSSRLREVVGGSQLLTRLCQEGAPKLLSYLRSGNYDDVEAIKKNEDNKGVVVADGGSFTILCQSPEEAEDFGRKLAELYGELTGSTLTVAKPEKWSGLDTDFRDANKAARRALAKAKRAEGQTLAVAHSPYTAFCASCGTALAHTHDRRVHKQDDEPKKERPNYLCRACQHKSMERDTKGQGFLYDFIQTVVGDEKKAFDPPEQAEDLAQDWDARNYVAYLVADGNGMGKIFGQCHSAEQLKSLSESLTRVLQESLAEPTSRLMRWVREEGKKWQIPVLPLILGGDDVFILLPAPYALDFARRFCLEYERRMKTALDELNIDAVPTMSAAVVICKASYPHTLAHQHGEALLKQAKKLSKAVALHHQSPHSTMTFDVILGSRIAGAGSEQKKDAPYHPSLRPYWVVQSSEDDETDLLPEGVGLPIDRILHWREALKDLPKRRLAQLRALFAPSNLPGGSAKDVGRWDAKLKRLIARCGAQADLVGRARQELGGNVDGGWYRVKRPLSPSSEYAFSGHGLPDLLEVWDFSLDLEKSRTYYEEAQE